MAKRKRVSLTKARIDAEILRQTLAGYAQVNQITADERRARLRALSDSEAHALFDDLCDTHQRMGRHDGDWEKLDRLRLEQKRAIRPAFERLARAKGLL